MTFLMTFLAAACLASQLPEQKSDDIIQNLLNQRQYCECLQVIWEDRATPTLHHYYQVLEVMKGRTNRNRAYREQARTLFEFLQQYFQDTDQIPCDKVVMRTEKYWTISQDDQQPMLPQLPIIQ